MTQASDPIGRNVAALQRIVAGLFARLAGRSVVPRRVHNAMQRMMRPAEAAARRLIIAAARGLVVKLPPLRPHAPAASTTQPRQPVSGRPFSHYPQANSRHLQAQLRHLHGKPGHPSAFPAASTSRPLQPVPGRPFSHYPHAKPGQPSASPAAPKEIRPLRFPLLDPLRRVGPPRIKTVPPHAAPRICVIGVTPLFRLPPAPTPHDPIDTSRLTMRLSALQSALANIPEEAMRFARWQARARQRLEAQRAQREAEAERASQDAQNASAAQPSVQASLTPTRQITGIHRTGARPRNPFAPPPPPRRRNWRRSWPLRNGRPPGGKQMGVDPASAKGRKITELDEILAAAHALAMEAQGS